MPRKSSTASTSPAKNRWSAAERGRARSGKREKSFSDGLKFEQPASRRQRVGDAGEAQAVPGHGVVAGGDRNAGETLKTGGGFGHPQAGAGDEDRFDPRRRGKALDRRFDRGDRDARGVAVVTTVESRDGGDGDAAGGERGDGRSVDLGRIRGEEADRPCAKRAKGGERGGDRSRAGDVRAGFADFGEHRLFAE